LERYPGIEGWLEGIGRREEVKRAYERVPAGEEVKE